MSKPEFFVPPIRSDMGKRMASVLRSGPILEIADWLASCAEGFGGTTSAAEQTDAETFAELAAKLRKLAEYAD